MYLNFLRTIKIYLKSLKLFKNFLHIPKKLKISKNPQISLIFIHLIDFQFPPQSFPPPRHHKTQPTAQNHSRNR